MENNEMAVIVTLTREEAAWITAELAKAPAPKIEIVPNITEADLLDVKRASFREGWDSAMDEVGGEAGSPNEDMAAIMEVLALIGWKDGYTRNPKGVKANESLQVGFEYLPGKKGCHINVELPANVTHVRKDIPSGKSMREAADIFVSKNQHLIKRD